MSPPFCTFYFVLGNSWLTMLHDHLFNELLAGSLISKEYKNPLYKNYIFSFFFFFPSILFLPPSLHFFSCPKIIGKVARFVIQIVLKIQLYHWFLKFNTKRVTLFFMHLDSSKDTCRYFKIHHRLVFYISTQVISPSLLLAVFSCVL